MAVDEAPPPMSHPATTVNVWRTDVDARLTADDILAGLPLPGRTVPAFYAILDGE